jgi:hypothetical protein
MERIIGNKKEQSHLSCPEESSSKRRENPKRIKAGAATKMH